MEQVYKSDKHAEMKLKCYHQHTRKYRFGLTNYVES